MEIIRTLCELCADGYRTSFTLKHVSGETATEKKKKCENCGRSFIYPADLKQYLITGKRGR